MKFGLAGPTQLRPPTAEPGRREKITKSCHSEPFAVILSEAKDLALGAQGKLLEESAVVCFQKDKSRFFASLRMTDDFFTAFRFGCTQSWFESAPETSVTVASASPI
jgi:hypothetical protein